MLSANAQITAKKKVLRWIRFENCIVACIHFALKNVHFIGRPLSTK
jgi:hypothetical protein